MELFEKPEYSLLLCLPAYDISTFSEVTHCFSSFIYLLMIYILPT